MPAVATKKNKMSSKAELPIMAAATESIIFAAEAADFLASRPTREKLLSYQPSMAAKRRLKTLMTKQRETSLTRAESQELAQFQQTEILLRLIKARLRQRKARP